MGYWKEAGEAMMQRHLIGLVGLQSLLKGLNKPFSLSIRCRVAGSSSNVLNAIWPQQGRS